MVSPNYIVLTPCKLLLDNLSFSLLLNKVAASKAKVKRNKTGFILCASDSPPST